ncbi:MAG: PAC2 family protein [Candidatus Methanoperedens sp.]|nr:PAC2 family protein [Candidatus Methanoperedens sp.]MCZ7371758.1 PAC2 family protein [Candidatus Methanoperedens sp.]
MELRFLKKPELEKPRMLVGLPGMGMVARTTVNYFMEILKPELFADIPIPHLSPSIAFFEKGLVVPFDREISPFKFFYSQKENIIFFSGDIQFGYAVKDNELAEKIVEAAQLCGVDIIYTVIATHVQRFVEDPEVFGVATTPELLLHLEGKGVKIADSSLQISGVNGLVVEYALRKGIKGIALLCETAFPEALDIKASHAGIKKVSELLAIDIDLSRIEIEAKKFDEGFKKYLKDTQEKKRKEEDLGYIG